MKTVNSIATLLVIVFLATLTNCNYNSKKNNTMLKNKATVNAPLVLEITLTENMIFKIPWDSLNWDKLEKDSTDYILFSLSIPFLKKKIYLKKDFVPLKTAFELSIRNMGGKYNLILQNSNYGSTHFNDSLIFLQYNKDSFFLTEAYYLQHSLWNQNSICPYFISRIDTISLEEKSINQDRCKNDFQETDILNILRQADYYWKEKEFDSAKKYYRVYLNATTVKKVDSTLIPHYVYKRLN